MSYNGWVPYRRGIIEHVLDGRLKGLEHYALSQLILMADASNGGYNVNAPILMYWCGYVFNLDTSEKILKALNDKRYIWYRGLRGSKYPQPYWINKYKLSRGQFATRMTNLVQLYDKSIVSQEDVYKLADQRTDERTDNYKKGEKRLEKKASIVSDDARDAEMTHEMTQRGSMSTATRSSNTTGDDARDARDAKDARDARNDARNDATVLGRIRIRIVTGDDPYPVDMDTGAKIPWTDAERLFASGEAIEVNA